MKEERNPLRGATGTVIFALILLAGFVAVSPGAARERVANPPAMNGAGYHLAHTYKLGGKGFWDYMGIDVQRHHLFVSHGTHVVVLDANSGKIVGNIPDTEGVHGIAIAPGLDRGFVSDGRSSMVTIFNLATLKTIGTVKVTGRDPDCIVYDPASDRVFTFNGRSDNSTAIDAKTGKVVGTIELGGRPEFAVADGHGHIYNNLEDKSEQVAIDTHTLKITNRWSLAPCQHPSGLAMDLQHRRLFAGCHNKLMGIVNPDAGKVVTTEPIGPGVDACRFDAGTQLAFCSSGGDGGSLTVVREDSPDHFVLLGHVKTEMGARTMELDPKTHDIFVDTATFGPRPAKATPQNRYRRPPMLPGSFRVLEYVR
jgi:DNA-binding beta-propeller fold protein YncE